jgi:hypothetical protein
VSAGTSLAFLPRPRIGLRVGLELGVPILRHDYAIGGLGRQFFVAPVTGALFAGVEGRFP